MILQERLIDELRRADCENPQPFLNNGAMGEWTLPKSATVYLTVSEVAVTWLSAAPSRPQFEFCADVEPHDGGKTCERKWSDMDRDRGLAEVPRRLRALRSSLAGDERLP